MLFWFQIVFCSTQIFDFNYLVDLENSSNYLKTFKNKGLCENEEIQQKTLEMTKTVNKYLDENPFDSNFLNDLADFIEESLNSGYKNVDYDLCDFLSSINAENNLVPPSCTKSTLITNVCKNQCCTLEQSIDDTTRFKNLNSNENDTAEHSYVNTSLNDDTNLLLHKDQNDLMQNQYANLESNTFSEKYNNVLISSSQQSYNVGNTSVNEPNDFQTDALFNVDILSTINNPGSSSSFNNAYRNGIDVKDKGKRPKTNKVSNIQTNGNKITLKSKRKKKPAKKL